MTEQPTDDPPEYSSVISKVGSTGLEERAAKASPNPPHPAETSGLVFSLGRRKGADLNAGQDVQERLGRFADPLTTAHGNISVPALTAAAPLMPSLRCRMCNATQTVATRPTVTTCGHLFCSEYVLRTPDGVFAGLIPN